MHKGKCGTSHLIRTFRMTQISGSYNGINAGVEPKHIVFALSEDIHSNVA